MTAVGVRQVRRKRRNSSYLTVIFLAAFGTNSMQASRMPVANYSFKLSGTDRGCSSDLTLARQGGTGWNFLISPQQFNTDTNAQASSIDQMLSGFNIGDMLQVTSYIAERSAVPPPETIQVLLGGASLGLYAPARTLWTQQATATTVANSTSGDPEFLATSFGFPGSEEDAGIDDLVVTDLGPSGVPQPSTLGLICLVVGGLVIVRRRQSEC